MMIGCGSGSSNSTADNSSAGDEVTTFGIGSTYAQVKAILGEPTEIETMSDTRAGVNWVVGGRKLSVTFGQDVNEDIMIPSDTNPETFLLSHIYMY